MLEFPILEKERELERLLKMV